MLLFIYLSSTFILLCSFVVLKRVKAGQKRAMGGWLSYMWWGGDPDTPNHISGLSRRDVYLVQKSWAPVAADSVANGTELLKRLFNAHPEIREYFKMVRNKPESEWVDNPQFKAHVLNLMTSITQAVSRLNEPEIVVAVMEKIGESHSKRKIKEQNFHDLKVVIVNMFIEVLNMDQTTLGAWGKTVDFWYKHLLPNLNDTTASR